MNRYLTSPVRGVVQLVAELREDGNGWILLFVSAGWFLSIGTRLVYPALVPYLQSEFGIDLATAGSLLTVLWLMYAIGQFPGGVLGDRIGEGKILLISTVISMGSVGIVVLSPDLLGVFFATGLFGLSTALYGPTRFTILSDVYSRRDGTAIGLTMAAGNAGNALLPFAAGTLAATYTWRVGLGFVVPLFLLVALGFLKFVPPDTSGGNRSADLASFSDFTSLLGDLLTGPILLLALIQILAAFVWQGFTGFYPAYLVSTKGISPTVASWLFGAFFAMGVVIQPVAGVCLDQFGIKRTLPVAFGLISLGLLLLPFIESLEAIVLVTLLMSSLLGYGPLTLTYLTAIVPEHIKGFGMGAIRTVYMTIAATAPVFVGVLADQRLFDTAFFLLSGIVGVAFFLSFLIPLDQV